MTDKQQEEISIEEHFKDIELPTWYKDCPLAFDWCEYGGEVYFASLNWDQSEKRQKPVFDLAYCATKALNNIFLKQRTWSKRFIYPTTKRN